MAMATKVSWNTETIAQRYAALLATGSIRAFPVVQGISASEQRDFPPFVSPSATPCWWQYSPPNSSSGSHASSSLACNVWQTVGEPQSQELSALCMLTALALYDASPSLYGNGTRTIGLVQMAIDAAPTAAWLPPLTVGPGLATSGAGTTARSSCISCGGQHVGSDCALQPHSDSAVEQSAVWNAMVAPASRYAIRAVLLSTGETDLSAPTFQASDFNCTIQAVISSWRRRWRTGDFAFILVGIGSMSPLSERVAQWPGTARQAQFLALPMPHGTSDVTGLADSYDAVDSSSPFPSPPNSSFVAMYSRNKTAVALRLAQQILHVQWAQQYPALQYDGPIITATAYNATSRAYVLTLTTQDGKPATLQPTTDCTFCCVGVTDTFQLKGSWVNATWRNASIALLPASGSILVQPAEPGPFAFMHYASTASVQCVVVSSAGIPMRPVEVTLDLVVESSTGSAVALGKLHVPQRSTPAEGAPEIIVHKPAATKVSQLGRGRVPAVSPWTTTGWKGHHIPDPHLDANGAVAKPPPMGFNS